MTMIALPFIVLIAGIMFSFLDWLRYSISEWFEQKAYRMYRGSSIFEVLADFFEGDVMLLFNISLTVIFGLIMVGAVMIMTGGC